MHFNTETERSKVLIVEDHDGFRHLMGVFLSKRYDVATAKSGLEAMAWLAKGTLPDAIILDAGLSDQAIDSARMLTNLRCSGLFGEIPVIMISEDESPLLEPHFAKLGAGAYLKKPFNPEQLQEQLDRCIRLSNREAVPHPNRTNSIPL
jgi:CheY-like chemotaxis protein